MATVTYSNPKLRALVYLVNYGMVVVLAWCLAYWIWVFFKPAPLITPPSSPQVSDSLVPKVLAGNWFGANRNEAASGSTLSIKLVGVFSSTTKRPGFAIFKLADGKQTHTVLNQMVQPSLQLIAIGQHSVTLLQNGVRHTLTLEGIPETKASFQAKEEIVAPPQTQPLPALSQQPPPPVKQSISQSDSGLLERLKKREEELQGEH